MKPHLEKVPQRIGRSWRYRKIIEPSKHYGWHRHEEYEIAIHRHFDGHCYLGHTSHAINHNHMVMFGPGIAHATYSQNVHPNQQCETHVVWFKGQWLRQLMQQCPELSAIEPILQQAQAGLIFSHATAEAAFNLLDDVLTQPAVAQLSRLLQLFSLLIQDTRRQQVLINQALKQDYDAATQSKIAKLDNYLQQHFQQPINLTSLAKHLFISESSVRRLFKKHYTESFSEHIKKLRLNLACELLMNTQLPINIIMERAGYANQANFNRQFKQYKQVSPLQFRKQLQAVGK